MKTNEGKGNFNVKTEAISVVNNIPFSTDKLKHL